MGEPVPTRVFVLDDHELLRLGLSHLVDRETDLQVVGEAGSARDALVRIPAVRPDVAVLDVRLPDGDGVEVCREIRSRHPEIRCLFLTSYDDDEVLFRAIMAGAAGYLVKQASGGEVAEAIRRVARGESLLDPTVTPRVLERLRYPQQSSLAHLSPREQAILDLIAEGLTNREIAQRIHLSEKTVRNYVSRVLAKLGVKHRTQAALFGAGLGPKGEGRPGGGR